MRVFLGIVLTLVCSLAHAGTERLRYDPGLRGLAQRLWGKKVKQGDTTHSYVSSGGALRLASTKTIANDGKRRTTTTTTFRAVDERMTVAEAKVALSGVRRSGYLFSPSQAGLHELERKSEIVEKASHTLGRAFTSRVYHLKDGVIEQWTNENGTTLQTP